MVLLRLLIVGVVVQCVMHNIEQSDVEDGQIEYVMHGKDDVKNRWAACLHSLLRAVLGTAAC